jgi:hypothetical protein
METLFRIQPGDWVLLNLHTPREKLWGQLLDISSAGIQLRGIDLHTFDDWVRATMRGETNIGLTHVFFPMWRVERLALDETVGEILSLTEVFRARTGISLADYLTGTMPPEYSD